MEGEGEFLVTVLLMCLIFIPLVPAPINPSAKIISDCGNRLTYWDGLDFPVENPWPAHSGSWLYTAGNSPYLHNEGIHNEGYKDTPDFDLNKVTGVNDLRTCMTACICATNGATGQGCGSKKSRPPSY